MSETGSNRRTTDSSPLRARAEESVGRHLTDLESRSPEEVQQLVYELEVHQIELEMQNQALREAQQELEASRDRYVDLYDFAPVGYVTLDAKGSVHQINLTAAGLLGTERTRLIGRRFDGYVAKGHQQPFRSHLRECAAGSSQASCEVQLCPKVGPPIPVKLDTVRVEDDEGTLYRTAITDITQRKQTEEALEKLTETLEQRVSQQTAELGKTVERLTREIDEKNKAEQALGESEQRFRAVVDNAPDGILLAEPESWRLTAGNEMVCQMLGYTREEFEHLAVPDIHPEQDLPQVMEQFEKQSRGEITLAKDIPVKRKDGTVFYADINAFRLTLAGKPYLAGILRDITDRRRGQESVRHSEARYRLIADNVTDMVWAGEIEGLARLLEADARAVVEPGTDELLDGWRFTFISPSIERLLGYEVDEGMRLKPKDLLTAASYATLQEAFAAELALERSGQSDLSRQRNLELEHVTKDGKRRWCEVSMKFLRDHKDQITGVVGSTRDVSPRKELEREISAAALHEQQRIGRELHDGLGQQLLGLRLMAKSLQKTLEGQGAPEAASAVELVQVATDAQDHVRAVIKGVRPVAIESGGLMAALGDLAGSTQQLAGVRCTCECHEPVAVENDHTATQLFHIAQEGVRNAVKHALANQITVGLTREDQRLRLWVRDDGRGVAAESGRTDGMGLRIMGYRAALVGGILAVEPLPGGGTLVNCTVPLEQLR